jgi:hypothetical protein
VEDAASGHVSSQKAVCVADDFRTFSTVRTTERCKRTSGFWFCTAAGDCFAQVRGHMEERLS